MQTIGERLEEARKKKGISLREAAEATKIRGDYLQKFEGNQFDIGLTEIYARGFLRTYCNFLKLPTDRIMADFAALGHGGAKARPPAREIYGRMEVTALPAETPPPPAPTAEPTPRTGPRPRTGSSLPKGLDPALVFKTLKIAGVVLGVVLVYLIGRALFSGGSNPTPSGPSVGLVALRPVNVTVTVRNPDDSDGPVLFKGAVVPGETKFVPRKGALFIDASIPENLLLEINGTRHPMGLPAGRTRGQLPAPQP
ncbi:MAG: helix-turn-helix domain-containing protein [Opitutaceae bacterium]|nr:helix-turn-helix domain-containing protein [Opitutaceae bacterium]